MTLEEPAPPLTPQDVAVDDHENPTLIRLHIKPRKRRRLESPVSINRPV